MSSDDLKFMIVKKVLNISLVQRESPGLYFKTLLLPIKHHFSYNGIKRLQFKYLRKACHFFSSEMR